MKKKLEWKVSRNGRKYRADSWRKRAGTRIRRPPVAKGKPAPVMRHAALHK